MERLGPPPGLITTYTALDSLAFPLETRSGYVVGTAAYGGTPTNWVLPPKTISPPLFSGGISGVYHHLQSRLGDLNQVLFVVPSARLAYGPLYVSVDKTKAELIPLEPKHSAGYAIMEATVPNQTLTAFDNGVLWLTNGPASSELMHLMVIRVDPAESSSAGYRLTAGTIEPNTQSGQVDVGVDGRDIGTPVVAYDGMQSALAGFVETSGKRRTDFIATSAMVAPLQAAARIALGESAGTSWLGVEISVAHSMSTFALSRSPTFK
jgi:hypothetical protein